MSSRAFIDFLNYSSVI